MCGEVKRECIGWEISREESNGVFRLNLFQEGAPLLFPFFQYPQPAYYYYYYYWPHHRPVLPVCFSVGSIYIFIFSTGFLNWFDFSFSNDAMEVV